jgi:hypothetical protein
MEKTPDRDQPINPPIDALNPRQTFYGAVACDAFKRAEHHEFDAAAYAVIMAYKTFGDADDYPAWEQALMESLAGMVKTLAEGDDR